MSKHAESRMTAAFIAVTTLFFAWGFITALIDPLVAAVRGIFTLSDVEAQLSASAFFIAYGLISFPAATLIARLRPVPSILLALSIMAAACLIMLGAANLANYSLVLVGLFSLASGITILQVAANPLAAALGKPEGNHFRLTMSQTFNSFGTFIAPVIGAGLFLKGVEAKQEGSITEAVRTQALAGIDRAYFWICGLLLVLFAFFWALRRTVAVAAPEPESGVGVSATIADAFGSRWALLGGAAIFLYVGAEVAIGTQMAFFLNSDGIWGQSDAAFRVPLMGAVMGSDGVPGVSLEEAARAVSFYWGGAMVGRALGTVLLARIPAARLMALSTAAAAAMCLYVLCAGGVSAGFVALAIGVTNSIVFPVIFTLTLERSTASPVATSGMLCTCIAGGAVLPPLTGLVAGSAGYVMAFIVPAVCYAMLCLFSLAAGTAPLYRSPRPSAAAH